MIQSMKFKSLPKLGVFIHIYATKIHILTFSSMTSLVRQLKCGHVCPKCGRKHNKFKFYYAGGDLFS